MAATLPWLAGWSGIGRITVGMARHGSDLQLTRYDGEGWRATFFPEGRAHSLTAAVETAWERGAMDGSAAGGVERAQEAGGGDSVEWSERPVPPSIRSEEAP